jgi:hypothetical protein
MKKLVAASVVAGALSLLAVSFPTMAGAGTRLAAAPTTGTINGTILGPGGIVVPGTCAVIFTPSSIQSFNTNSSGAYSATGLSGESEVVGQMCSTGASYAPVVYKHHPGLEGNANIIQRIDVKGGSTHNGIDVELVKGGTLVIKMVDATTNAPIDNAEVCPYLPALDADNDQVQSGYCALSGTNGVASISDVVAGETVVQSFGNSDYNGSYYNDESSFSTATQVEVKYDKTTKITMSLTPTSSD